MQCTKNILKINNAIYSLNINILTEMEKKKSKNQGKCYYLGTFELSDEDEILETYSQSFDCYNNRILDLPINICISCHKMCYRQYVTCLNKIKKISINEYWNNLIKYVQVNNLPNEYVCNYCLKIFRTNCLSPTCILNSLHSRDTPHVLSISHQNKWLQCNDTAIHFERWPRGGKNVYIIIMEKKLNMI